MPFDITTIAGLPFFIVGVIGLVLLVLSLLLGELLDGLFHSLHGVFDALDNDLLSGTAIGGAFTTFGFTAGLVRQSQGTGVSVVCGLLAGLAVGSGVALATRSLMSGDDSSTVRSAALVGASGTVVTEIPADGFGQVSVVVNGHITRLSARSDDHLASGAQITVLEVLSPTSVRVAAPLRNRA